MEIKFYRMKNEYIVYDADDFNLIGKKCLIQWEQIVDLDNYFYYDEKGCLYDEFTGAPVGYFEILG